MQVFDVRDAVIADYRCFTRGSVQPRAQDIKDYLVSQQAHHEQWPDPWISLNPQFATGGTIAELVSAGLLHPECSEIFTSPTVTDGPSDPDRQPKPRASLTLHRHQRDAIEQARRGGSFVLTTGTGSGKSLAYIIPIVDSILRERDQLGYRRPGVKAIVVYPMNALANSQLGELDKFLADHDPPDGEPITYRRYTGQEKPEERAAILRNPPDILLTNYVMLELVLTRSHERGPLVEAASGLRYLVLDELHSYRGRQGADVAFLVRRLQNACASPTLDIIGTSATMASGNRADQARAVSEVASRLFGTDVPPEAVIGETLARATVADPHEVNAAALAESQGTGFAGMSYSALAQLPLAAWVEDVFGLDSESDPAGLIRRAPTRMVDAAKALADLTGCDPADATSAIRSLLLAGAAATHPETGRPLFAFRLHQFISKGDNLHATIAPEGRRELSDHKQLRLPSDHSQALLPLAFCRECGQEYLKAPRLVYANNNQRWFAEQPGQRPIQTEEGYLYLSDSFPWPANPVAERRLPDHWLVEGKGDDLVVKRNRLRYLPEEVWLAPDGSQRAAGNGQQAWWVPSPFAFCLRCTTAYDNLRSNDYARLATLDREGRASAMTVIASSLIRVLKALPDAELPPAARKLLTFVDNRQDAALQSGHFNDFVQVAQLRGAVYAAALASNEPLTYAVIAQRVTDALKMDLVDYAADPDAKYSARDATMAALRAVVEYRLFVDLRLGYRLTLPNLEQTGLIHIDYADIDAIADDAEAWALCHHLLREAVPKTRAHLCRTVITELRRERAIDVECLTPEGFERIQRQSEQRLIAPWSLADNERMETVGAVFASPKPPRADRSHVHLTGRSAFGMFLTRPEALGPMPTADRQEIIADLLSVLARAGVLVVTDTVLGSPGYRLRAGAIQWRAGTGKHGLLDPVRTSLPSEATRRTNPYFVRLYRDVAATLRGFQAREHTAQVPADQRQERETAFANGEVEALFCSPTMELGVDIRDLNTVALRNVPPTPANYAQRSGRAGRSGQPALVVTYCSNGSPHDRYFFRRSAQMVAGSVQPPRLDLANEDLVRSHIHAIWLAETGADLPPRITNILDTVTDDLMPIDPDIWRRLSDPEAGQRAIKRGEAVLRAAREQWPHPSDVTWWSSQWVTDQITQAPAQFDQAFDRWRALYVAAKTEYDQQSALAIDAHANRETKKLASARAAHARTQLDLLANDAEERGHSDFYSYRYLASEGFLPGYSFPRLPLAAFIPGQAKKHGAYVQRPRFVAISEFGPKSLIYHEGSRYEAHRVQITRSERSGGDLETDEATRCSSCGYHHSVQVGTDTCDSCGAALPMSTRGLLRLRTVFTRPLQRISSDEEERRRQGFELETSYRFAGTEPSHGRVRAIARGADGMNLAELDYGDSATIRVSNVGLRRRAIKEVRGFVIDALTGRWANQADATAAPVLEHAAPTDLDAPVDERAMKKPTRVIPYVEDRRNILVWRLAKPVAEHVSVTLRYALERGAEAYFQLEDSELHSEDLPDPDHRGRFMLMEAAEGGAGALRRLLREPEMLATVARLALDILHFDDDGTDRGSAGDGTACALACYDCLLAYYNQPDHALLDRHSVRDLLLELATAEVMLAQPAETPRRPTPAVRPDDHPFLRLLAGSGHRLPDSEAAFLAGVGPIDWVYALPNGPVAVLLDSADLDRARQDQLEDQGISVVRLGPPESWSDTINEFPSVFGIATLNSGSPLR